MSRRWARRIERYCCRGLTYFPLVFVYGITTWAVWVVVKIGSFPVPAGRTKSWTGKPFFFAQPLTARTFFRQGTAHAQCESLMAKPRL